MTGNLDSVAEKGATRPPRRGAGMWRRSSREHRPRA